VAPSPLGPFIDELPQPFVCQFDRGGTIDPFPFQDDNGAVSLLVKSEGKPGEPTRIWSQPLTSDGASLDGAPVQLAVTDQPWEQPIIEGPAMVRADGWYWLLYAGNDWASPNYAVGDARCRTPQGPCVKDPRGPLLATSGTMAGPGSPGFVTGPDGRLLLTYHGWTAGKVGYPTGARALRAQPLSIVDARPALPGTPRARRDGYRLVADDGGVFGFGSSAYLGSTGDLRLNSPIRASAATPSGQGYWLAAGDGGIFSFGDAPFLGSTGALRLNKPIVGMATTSTGRGYWLVASDGGIFSFGDAGFFGSTGSLRLNKPIVAMAPTMTGRGYWLVASDGGVFSFGDAAFLGSTGDLVLNSPIVSMMTMPWSDGYWMVAADGGLFAFGDAPFLGSAGGTRLAAPIVSAMATPGGGGYWLAGADGTVVNFGDAGFFGSVAGGTGLNRPIVTMAR